jgi:hypothetical protein
MNRKELLDLVKRQDDEALSARSNVVGAVENTDEDGIDDAARALVETLDRHDREAKGVSKRVREKKVTVTVTPLDPDVPVPGSGSDSRVKK